MKTVPGNPHQNGVVEHMNMTILEHADIRFAQTVLGIDSQYGGVSNQ